MQWRNSDAKWNRQHQKERKNVNLVNYRPFREIYSAGR